MPYWWIVTRSFRIAWDHKYLWLLGLFAGEGGAGFNFSYNQRTPTSRASSPGAAAQNFASWMSQHVGLLVAIGIIWLLLVIAFFILAALCEGALIRGSAEHDAERPFNLRVAWTSGVHTMWLIVRFRLLLLALGLPAVFVLIAVIGGAVIAGISNHVALAVVLILLAIPLVIAAIVYFIYLNFLDRLGARTAILEERGAGASIGRAHRLLFKRLGRTLLVWLLSIAVGIVVGIVLGIALLIVLIPVFIAGYAAFTGGPVILWVFVATGFLVLLAIALPVLGFVAAQASTYWTLAFRRLDLDYPAQQVVPPPPAPA